MADGKRPTNEVLENSILVDRTKNWEGTGFIMTPEPITCPKCGSEEVRRILWGLPAEPPDPEIYHVGGCLISDEQWHCNDCEHEW